MRKRLIAVGVVLVLGAGAGAWWNGQGGPEAKVMERVRSTLSDPGSAEFRHIIYSTKHDTGCGFVNARNRMGGMAGYQAFIAFPDGTVRTDPSVRGEAGKAWQDQALIYCDVGQAGEAFWNELTEQQLRALR